MKKVTLIALTALIWAGCGSKEEDPAPVSVEVQVVRAEVADWEISVEAPATVFPRQQANLSSRLTASIRRLAAGKGDRVSAGQLLAELEDRDLRAQQREAEAQISDARANLERVPKGTLPTEIEKARGEVAKTQAALNQAKGFYDRRRALFEQGAIPGRDLVISETDLAQAQANHQMALQALEALEKESKGRDIQMAQSRLEQAEARASWIQAQLEFAELRSPFRGVITEQFLYPGDMAKPDTAIFRIMDLETVVARAQVPEADAARIRLGQICWFQPIDDGATRWKGRLSVVSQTVDPARRSVEVWCELSNPSLALRAGAFGRVRIVTETIHDAVVAPLKAVELTTGSKGRVMIVQDGKRAVRREVETGTTQDGRIHIKSGLRRGDLVVTEGGYSMPDGTPVRFREAQP